MARGFSSSAVEEVKARLNILDIVRRYVQLQRAGSRWVAPCPFHQETKPSFSVDEQRGVFYCFGCQASGDIFHFYGRINGLDFKESLIQLAEEAGVELKNFRENPKAKEDRDFRQAAVKMHELARTYFQRALHGESGAKCREYIEKRLIAPEIIETFELGWSTDEWSGLSNTLTRSGFSQEDGARAGLLSRSERGSYYDRFRGRLMFPIKNLSGQIIAFGGRIIGGEDAAKYINSSDSPIYKKGDNLYGLFQARRAISIAKSALLTEGYMDVLTLHQFGYKNACGVLGTALTQEQVHRLAGFCSDFELLFDGDGPGRKAAMRGCQMILAKGLRCRVTLLPDGEDIDSLLHGKGTEAFEALRRMAPDGLDFCIRTLNRDFAPREHLEWSREFLRAVEQKELLSRYITDLSRGLGLDESELRRSATERSARPAQAGPEDGGREQAAVPQNLGEAEQRLMLFLVRCPQYFPRLEALGADMLFGDPFYRSLLENIKSCAPEYSASEILHKLDDKERAFWTRNRDFDAPPPGREEEEFAEISAWIQRFYFKQQSKSWQQAILHSGRAGGNEMELLRAVQAKLRAQQPGSESE